MEQAGWGFFSQRSGENIEGVGFPRVNQLYATVSLRHGPPMQPGSHTDRLAALRRSGDYEVQGTSTT